MRKSGLVVLVLAIVSAGLVAATSTSAVAVKAPSGEPILIGQYIPVAANESGVSFPQSVAAAKAAIRGINKAGGLDGRPLKLDECDPGNDPNAAEACARQFVDDGVVAIVGSYARNSDVVQPIVGDAGIVNVGPGGGNADYAAKTAVLLDSGALGAYGSLGFAAEAAGLKKIFVAHADSANASVVINFVKAGAKAAGIEFVGSVAVPASAPDFAPYAAAAKDAGADIVAIVLSDPDSVKFINAATLAGDTFEYAHVEGIITPKSFEQLGKEAEGLIEVGAYPPPSSAKQFPVVARFLKDMKAEYKAGDKDAAPDLIGGTNGLLKWLSVQAVADVIKQLPPGSAINKDTVLNGFNTVQNLDFGLWPPITPSVAGPISILPKITNPYVFFTKVKNGKRVLISTKPFDPTQKVDLVKAISGG